MQLIQEDPDAGGGVDRSHAQNYFFVGRHIICLSMGCQYGRILTQHHLGSSLEDADANVLLF